MQIEHVRRQVFLRSNEMLRIAPPVIVSAIVGLIIVLFSYLFEESFRIYDSVYAHHPAIVFILTPTMFLLTWGSIYFCAPGAGGGGVAQIKAALASHEAIRGEPPLLGVRVLVFKILSALFCAMGGGAIGPEGPCVQIGSSCFYIFQKRLGRYPALRKFNLNAEMAILTGGAAGLAAAFNTPLGGIVFAIEELSTRHVREFESQTILGVITAGLVAQAILGTYLYIGLVRLDPVTSTILLWCIPLALACGAAGAYFTKFILISARFRRKLPLAKLAALAIGLGLIMAVLQYFIAAAAGPGTNIIHSILTDGKTPSLVEVATRFVGPLVSISAGGSAGIFAPSLGCGAAMGSWLAGLLGIAGSASTLTLVGMLCFLTGVTKAPLTSFTLVYEMTDAHTMAIPLMLTTLIAYSAARIIFPQSMYGELMKFFVHDNGSSESTGGE